MRRFDAGLEAFFAEQRRRIALTARDGMVRYRTRITRLRDTIDIDVTVTGTHGGVPHGSTYRESDEAPHTWAVR